MVGIVTMIEKDEDFDLNEFNKGNISLNFERIEELSIKRMKCVY